MRDLLFRGKSRENGDWYEGNLEINKYYRYSSEEKDYRIVDRNCGIDDDGFAYYQSGCDESCDPKTIGQFTGVYDKNGKKIFEGDIVMKRTYHGKKPCKVVFSYGCFHCGFGGGSSTATHPYLLDTSQYLEVVGNIYDNPEMLEVEK